MSTFIQFLVSRNKDFICNFTSESALGMVGTLCGIPHGTDPRKNCVLISFDPPVGHPPLVFNWSEADVWYVPNPAMEAGVFERIDEMVSRSLHQRIVFVERDSPEHMRKIQRFIRNYKKHVFRNRPLSELPGFVLAEFNGPFSRVKLKELQEETHDQLLS